MVFFPTQLQAKGVLTSQWCGSGFGSAFRFARAGAGAGSAFPGGVLVQVLVRVAC